MANCIQAVDISIILSVVFITISTSIVVGSALTHLTYSLAALVVLPAIVVGIAATVTSLAPVFLSNSCQLLLRDGTGLLPVAYPWRLLPYLD